MMEVSAVQNKERVSMKEGREGGSERSTKTVRQYSTLFTDLFERRIIVLSLKVDGDQVNK